MGTQYLKYLVSKDIGKHLGSFSIPIVATYVVKDQVEKWSDEVVEDTSQNTMKIKIMYVVKGKMIASSFA